MLDAFRQDLAYAVRSLRTQPVFAAAVMLTLALGIGANASMFTVFGGLVLVLAAVDLYSVIAYNVA